MTHTFTLVLDRRPTADELDRAAESGLDDAAFGTELGVSLVEFDRESGSLADAVASAVHDLDAIGLVAVRVVDQDLVTLADVADRIRRSREAVRRYAIGERGPGGFPPPVNPDREGTLFYHWSEVVPWLREELQLDLPDVDPVLVVANLVLQARRLTGRVAHVDALTDLFAG